ncbi:MAG TPA: hypothetical protein PLQ88_30840, partial [Blastocatellia bacterium]|nr:hypothetical protein [Blastocatellia bacterium]
DGVPAGNRGWFHRTGANLQRIRFRPLTMPHVLEFELRHRYLSREGIWIPATLVFGGKMVDCRAKMDPGAEFCVFRRDVADELKIEVEQGYPLMMDSPGGQVETFGHEVVLRTFDYAFETMVYFASNPYFTRNLLGRNGWLNQVKLAVIDYEETLFISPYNQPQ